MTSLLTSRSIPILYIVRSFTASVVWPVSWKGTVQSLPACSSSMSGPPGCYKKNINMIDAIICFNDRREGWWEKSASLAFLESSIFTQTSCQGSDCGRLTQEVIQQHKCSQEAHCLEL